MFPCICEYWQGKFWQKAYDLSNSPIFPLPKLSRVGITQNLYRRKIWWIWRIIISQPKFYRPRRQLRIFILANLLSKAANMPMFFYQSFVLYHIASGFISLGADFPEWSVLSFSRNFPCEIYDPNNWKTHMSEISHKLYTCAYMSNWTQIIDEMLAHDPFAVAVNIENFIVPCGQTFIAQAINFIACSIKCPNPATQVTKVCTLQPMALGLHVYRPSGYNCVHANFFAIATHNWTSCNSPE